MDVRVTELRRISGNGPLRAFVSIMVNDWTIHDWRIVKRDDQRVWVSVPQVSWRDQSGKVKYRALLSIPGELKQQIEVAILSAWEAEKNKDGERG